MKSIILIISIFSVSTIAFAVKKTNDHYVCTVKERYTAFFWPTKIDKDGKGLVEFQHDIKNEYIINLKIILEGNNATVSIKNKSTPNIKDEWKFIKMEDSVNGFEISYAGVENDKKNATWLFKVDESNEWRYFGNNISSSQNMDVGLMVFDCN